MAALLTVLTSVFNKKIVDKYEPVSFALYQLTGGFAGLTLLLPLLTCMFPSRQFFPSALDWVWLVVLSWVCTILTFFMFIKSLKKLSAFTTNLTLTLEPVYGIVLAFFFYKENKLLSKWFYLGFALIAVAVAFHMWRLLRGMGKRQQAISNNENR